MAISYGFFDARQSSGGTYDRVYTAEQMSKYFKGLISDGVLMNEGSALAVSASSGMVIQVGTGRAFLDSRWMQNDTVLDLTVADAHAVLHRKDIVVAQLDYDNRLIDIMIKTGTAASTPSAPTVTRSASYFELELAEISVPAGTTAITQTLITDKRADEDVCGYVTGLIEQIDTETFWTQLQDAFLAWFDEMKDQLDEDAAGHLQLEIDDIIENQLGIAVEADHTSMASAHTAGEYVYSEGHLYRLLKNLAVGTAIVTGTGTQWDSAEQVTINSDLATERLWFKDAPVSATTGQILDISDSRITKQHVLAEIHWGDSSKVTTLTDWSTDTAGHFIITGTATAATTATVLLVRAVTKNLGS